MVYNRIQCGYCSRQTVYRRAEPAFPLIPRYDSDPLQREALYIESDSTTERPSYRLRPLHAAGANDSWVFQPDSILFVRNCWLVEAIAPKNERLTDRLF
jgi:hypothetical protein